jgi:N-methylhydantoinase B
LSGRDITQDAVALEILWERCISIVDEAADTLVRAAFSTVARESNDYGCALCDSDGVGIGYTTKGTPRMGIILPRTIRAILEKIPRDSLKPGDVLFTNDPWYGSGHLPDFYIAVPIFRKGKLVGISGACSHVSDIGGSIAPDSREVYEEGICFPPVKLFREGEPDTVLLAILEKNVRVPHMVIGDLNALIASCRRSAGELVRLMDDVGVDDLRPVAASLGARTEKAFREAIRTIPPGTYASEIQSDGFRSEITLKCAITVAGSDISIDCAGTSPQVSPGGINVVYNFTYSAFVYALKCILDPHTPYNEGITRPVKVTVPERTILNAQFPAPVFARNQTAHYLPTLVMDALAKAVPDRVMAACGSPTNRTTFHGRNGVDGRPFSYMMISSGGMGAASGKDGYSCTPYPSNSGSAPVEVIESVVPLTIRRKVLRPDSGGAGQYRGGLGIELVVENSSDETMHVASRMDRVKNPPRGLAGGGDGSTAAIWRADNQPFPPKGKGELRPGETITIHSPGGGGYGPPDSRAPDRLASDVEEGFVSADAAKALYGWTGK